MSTSPIRIFICYAIEDEALKEELLKHLSPLKRQGIIQDWHFRNISAGREWEKQINEHLESSDIILLLISADFIASDYCYTIEMKRALELHHSGLSRVVPVILRQVYWRGIPFETLEVVPKDARPVTSWPNLDEAFADVAKKIWNVCQEIITSQMERATDRNAFEVDRQVMQLATSAFYSDVHSGWKDINGDDDLIDASTFRDNVWGRTRNDTTPGHYFPTAIAQVSNHILILSSSEFDSDNRAHPLVLGWASRPATDAEIQSHAIWMGLLVNSDGLGTQEDGSQDRGRISPLGGQTALYIKQIPASTIAGNDYNGGPVPGGRYCWVVAKNGYVLALYKGKDGRWYSG